MDEMLLRVPPARRCSSEPTTEIALSAATFMDDHLADKVRSSLEACLQIHPKDPIRFLAQKLKHLHNEAAGTTKLPAADSPPSENAKSSPVKHRQWPVPPMIRLEGGGKYELRPLAQEFCSAIEKRADSSELVNVFPSVDFCVALSTYEAASCLRRLHLVDPSAPLLVLIEAPAPTSTIFFYEGIPFNCMSVRADVIPASPAPTVLALQEALGEDKVCDFTEGIRTALVEAVASAHISIIPSLQTDYLAAFDVIDAALRATVDEEASASPLSSARPFRRELPAVLFISYRADTARLTYARILASYGPYYEAAQRASLLAFRAAQLERKNKYNFAYVMEHWARVQRQRQVNSSGPRMINSLAKTVSVVEARNRSDNDPTTLSQTVAAAGITMDKSVAATTLAASSADTRRSATRSGKRAALLYDSTQQAEDDVFLVVVRRLEHAAATLIQAQFRGFLARRLLRSAREIHHASETTVSSVLKCEEKMKDRQRETSQRDNLEPPLLQASLERLYREGEAFGAIWSTCAISPPPESRRCWIYRPVQCSENDGDGGSCNTATTTREGWIQEELLLPPWRAAQPRLHLNLRQRLLDYLALAQCGLLREAVQLLTDSPGMSVLQRRAYDIMKSVCLTLFYVAYSELRQRQLGNIPTSFSTYMRQTHADVLGWFSIPHECSLLVRAVRARAFIVANGPPADAANTSRSAATARAARDVVLNQIAARERLVVASCPLYLNKRCLPSAEALQPLCRVTPHLYVTREPLLPQDVWVQAVSALPECSADGATDAPAVSVVWMTLAAYPLCYIAETSVAALRRTDTQKVEGASAYDVFVPRLLPCTEKHEDSVAQESLQTTSCVSPPPHSTSTTMVLQEWLQSDLTSAADAALVFHVTRSLSEGDGLEYYHLKCAEGSGAVTPFSMPKGAELLRRTLRNSRTASTDHCAGVARITHSRVLSDVSESSSFASTQRRRTAVRGESWERVMETVVQESTVHRSSARTPVSSTAPSREISESEMVRLAPISASATSASAQRLAAALPGDELQGSGAVEDDAAPVRSIDEVAKEVGAALPGISFMHLRLSLQFVAGASSHHLLDRFLNRVASSLQEDTHRHCLVLAADLPSQGFYSLAAALLVSRMHDTQEASAWSSKAAAPSSAGMSCDELAKDPQLSFLATFHEVLEAALLSSSKSRTPVTTSAVRSAAQYVHYLMVSAPEPHLDILSRIRFAVKEAEHAHLPAAAITRATQLSEQYALLVMLAYYLWCPQSCFVAPSMPGATHPVSVMRMTGSCAFATFVNSAPRAVAWIAHIDPWACAPARCPDPLHMRYSNGLRRWDDKNYVCFGAQ